MILTRIRITISFMLIMFCIDVLKFRRFSIGCLKFRAVALLL
jgi:hypothetical protein